MFANFERHIDKHGECKFILAGESGKFNEERISGHLPMSYHLWYGRGAVAYFIFKVFQNLLAEWASVPRLFNYVAIIIIYFNCSRNISHPILRMQNRLGRKSSVSTVYTNNYFQVN